MNSKSKIPVDDVGKAINSRISFPVNIVRSPFSSNLEYLI